MRITIAGAGYVGMSLAVLLSQHNEVTALDILESKVALINQRKSPIADRDIEKYLASKPLNLTATMDAEQAYRNAELVVIATPTNYDPVKDHFDTSSIDAVLKLAARYCPDALIVIKSTVQVGFLEATRKNWPQLPGLLFSPEFLREGHALYDNLHPSRIIVGVPKDCPDWLRHKAEIFAGLLRQGAIDQEIPVLILNSTEAESVKLFANTYLALRVAYFNELDSYAEQHGLNSAQIIKGVCLDPRIGTHYNNPSFGYGGYCLPKDTRQLMANYWDTPNSIISAIVTANKTRKNFVASRILTRKPHCAGIYRLTMKSHSDNFRQAAILDIMTRLRDEGLNVVIYEPVLKTDTYSGFEVINDLTKFKAKADVIVANRMTEELKDCKDKIYTRDLFGRD